MKQYSLSYWVKHAFQFESKPENLIVNAVEAHASRKPHPLSHYQGSPLDLLNDLYVEWRKRVGSVHGCLFPTPLPVAAQLAEFAEVTREDVVFDPGCGLGNLLDAARARGARAFGVETQYWIPPLAPALHLDIQRGDYLDGYTPKDFTCVLTNPPFGKIWDCLDATEAFLSRLADQCERGVRIAAILTRDYIRSERPKSRLETLQRFEIKAFKPLPPDTFKPLTSVATAMVLMLPKTKPRGIVPAVSKSIRPPASRPQLNLEDFVQTTLI